METVHGLLGRGVTGCGGDVDELLGVARVDDLGERVDGLCDVVAMLATAAGDGEFVVLVPALYDVEDDVLLQNAVVAEGGLAGFKDMNAAKFQMTQKVLTERTEIRAIAKAPWRDADELAPGSEQALNESNEAGVEVAGFNPDGTERLPLSRVGADFAVWRIGDRDIESRRKRAEQIPRTTCRHFLDKVGGVNGERKENTSVATAMLALLHGRGEGVQDFSVKFVEGRFDGTDTVAFLTTPGDERGSECACARAGI